MDPRVFALHLQRELQGVNLALNSDLAGDLRARVVEAEVTLAVLPGDDDAGSADLVTFVALVFFPFFLNHQQQHQNTHGVNKNNNNVDPG